jgi:hypothetical protein
MEKAEFAQVPGNVLGCAELNSTAKLVYALLKYRQGENPCSYWGLTAMAKDLSMSSVMVWKAVNQLEKTGWIKVKRGSACSKGTEADTNKYIINHKPELTPPLTIVKAEHKPELIKKKNTKVKTKVTGKKQQKRFVPPTPQAVTEYAKSIGFDLDGDHFCNYYEVRGWMIGKSKIRSWKACVRTWKTRAVKNEKGPNDQGDDGPPIRKLSREHTEMLGVPFEEPEEAIA